MKYSLRSLMIVVTLVAIVSGLVARSWHSAEQAAFHRGQLPLGWHCGDSELSPDEWLRFHEQSAVAFERVSKMPLLPLSLPQAPPPVDPKEEFEKQQAMDALRTRLAKEAREKYGVP